MDTSPPSANETLRDGESLEGQRVLAGVMSGLFGGEREAVRLGRFVLLRRLGAGGMGEVFACYDATLDRKVAIKVLHRRGDAERGRVEERLRAEAKAIAKLAHPNVVPVFEVGEDDGELYLVMELIEGVTLRAWLAAAPRSRAEILDAFEQVARGLVAAHAAGLVHRDLKPDNALVGDDGRVRLVDFGLARSGAPLDPDGAVEAGRSTLAGTPRYMAPEQFAGGAVDARADQFAFCVSLFEALYGVPPFGGRSFTEVAAKVLGGEIDPPPTDRGVPGELARVIRRGLQTDPQRRFPSMEALLLALAAARKAPRRRALVLGGVVLGAGLLGVFAIEARRERACAEQGAIASERWHAARDAVTAGLRATAVPWLGSAQASVDEGVAAWTAQWGQTRERACLARDAGAGEMAEKTASCLDDGLAQLDAVLEVLVGADARVAANTADLLASLPAPADCVDPLHLAAMPALPPPQQREAVAALVSRLARLRAQNTAGLYALAHEEALALLPEVERIGHAPTQAELLLRLGKLDDLMGDLAASEQHLQQAYFLAGAHGLSRTAALAAISLAVTVGVHGYRTAAGQAWIDHATMMAARLDDAEVQIALHHAAGGIHSTRGAFDDGVRELHAALALATARSGDGHPALAAEWIAIGAAESGAGRSAAAREAFAQARALVEQGLGEGHPLIAAALHNLANDQLRTGDFAGAEATHREALAIRERAFGPDNLEVASSLSGIGAALGHQGDAAGSYAHFARAVALTERILGAEHPRLASDLGNAGLALLMLGRFGEARAIIERACGLLEQGPAAEGDKHASCLENLADAEVEHGRLDEAIAAYERALAIRGRTGGTKHPMYGVTTANLAIALGKAGRDAEAIAHFERAVAILADGHPALPQARLGLGRAYLRTGDAKAAVSVLERALATAAPSSIRGELRDALGRALWAVGERARARALVGEAVVELDGLGATVPRDAARAWLVAHAGDDPPR